LPGNRAVSTKAWRLETIVLTLGEAAKHLGVSKPTLSKAIKTGKLSATRREDGSWAIDASELARYTEANGHRFRPATPETTPAETAATATLEAQIAGLREVAELLRSQLADALSQRDRWQEAFDRQRVLPPPKRRWWWRSTA
jgi:excisionase family DNA binding protein